MERMDCFISFTLEVGRVNIGQLEKCLHVGKNQLVNHTLKVYNDCGREILKEFCGLKEDRIEGE